MQMFVYGAHRRAVRYGRKAVWRHLLSLAETDVNMANQYGLTALHTACRSN
jgi:hypothetical protein